MFYEDKMKNGGIVHKMKGLVNNPSIWRWNLRHKILYLKCLGGSTGVLSDSFTTWNASHDCNLYDGLAVHISIPVVKDPPILNGYIICAPI